jgi:hypothetical protein
MIGGRAVAASKQWKKNADEMPRFHVIILP